MAGQALHRFVSFRVRPLASSADLRATYLRSAGRRDLAMPGRHCAQSAVYHTMEGAFHRHNHARTTDGICSRLAIRSRAIILGTLVFWLLGSSLTFYKRRDGLYSSCNSDADCSFCEAYCRTISATYKRCEPRLYNDQSRRNDCQESWSISNISPSQLLASCPLSSSPPTQCPMGWTTAQHEHSLLPTCVYAGFESTPLDPASLKSHGVRLLSQRTRTHLVWQAHPAYYCLRPVRLRLQRSVQWSAGRLHRLGSGTGARPNHDGLILPHVARASNPHPLPLYSARCLGLASVL